MDVSGDLEGEVVEGGEEEELDAAGTQHEPVDYDVQPDVEGNHQEELNEENLVGESVEDDEPMVQNHQPDGLAELVSNLGVDVEGIDVGVAEEGLDLEGGDEQDFEYENNQGEEDLVGEEYQDYIEGDQVGEVYEGDEGEEGHQAYYDEEQDEDDEAYNEEEGEFYQGYGESQAKKPKMQEQEEEVVLESSDDEESSAPGAKPQPAQQQQWPMQQRIQQAQFGLQVQQQPLHQQQARAPMPPTAQFGLQQLHHQSMYADLLHGRGQQQFHPHQFAPMQRKRRRRTPTALCIKVWLVVPYHLRKVHHPFFIQGRSGFPSTFHRPSPSYLVQVSPSSGDPPAKSLPASFRAGSLAYALSHGWPPHESWQSDGLGSTWSPCRRHGPADESDYRIPKFTASVPAVPPTPGGSHAHFCLDGTLELIL